MLSLTPELAATLEPCLSSAVFASIHKALTDPALAAIRQLIDKSVSTESKWHKYVMARILVLGGGITQVRNVTEPQKQLPRSHENFFHCLAIQISFVCRSAAHMQQELVFAILPVRHYECRVHY